ncbi:MAG: 50S ribosomal protein L11 methyltransferase [Rhodospirillales bacterium]|nr:50S ribosomal protein L11 methyltransferase [Rhodospirillales bacterium]
MNKSAGLWRIEVAATAESVNAFEQALDPFCEAISWFATDSEGEWRIEGFTETRPDGADLAAALSVVAREFSIAVPEVSVISVEKRDWVADNLRMFPPTDAGRFFVYGTHYDTPPPVGRVPILLNPGRAFGSGEHQTTMGCLLALSDLVGMRKFKKPLDMGCGSGILSIAIAKAWRVPVRAVDIDINSIVVARQNIHRNGVPGLVRASRSNGYDSPLVRQGGPYDLIVSNILANPLCNMAKSLGSTLRNATAGGGIVILAGFLECDANRVYAAHYRQGFRLMRSYHIRGWRTLVLQRRPALGTACKISQI